MSVDRDLALRRALVTGGTRGMGQAVTRLLAARGAEVLIAVRSTPTSWRRFASTGSSCR